MAQKPRVLSDFKGDWKIDRHIAQGDGPDAQFVGQATFTPQGDALAYHEQGLLHLPRQPLMQAERRYLWQPDLTVWFDDGRFFHQVPAAGGDSSHWCDPDQYDVSYNFTDWPLFTVIWRVQGPRKDYTLRSIYRPV